MAASAATAERRASSKVSVAARTYASASRSTSSTTAWRASRSAATLRTAASGWRSSVRARGLKLESLSRSEEHTSELQSRLHLVCRLLLEKKKGVPRQAERPADTAA